MINNKLPSQRLQVMNAFFENYLKTITMIFFKFASFQIEKIFELQTAEKLGRERFSVFLPND
jgi:hypothetical protein